MDKVMLDKYQDEQTQYRSRYLELISDYKSQPRNPRSTNNALEEELQKVECAMLDNPPLSEVIDEDGNSTGVVKPRAKGLILPHHSKLEEPNARPISDFKVIPISEWGKYISDEERVDLRNFVPEGMILDQDGVGSCFPAKTYVRMKNGSEKYIEDIKVLDEVLTAEGNIGIVTQVMVRKHVGELCILFINGSHHVKMTPEHPVLTENRGYVQAKNLMKNDMIAFPKYLPQTEKFIQTIEYVFDRKYVGSKRKVKSKCGSFTYKGIPDKTEKTVYKHPLPDIIYLTHGFGRIIGLFLAEGNTSYGKVTWTFSIDEKETLADELVNLLDSELNIRASLAVCGNNTVKVNVYGVQWAKLFESLCGKLAGGKKLHDDLIAGNKDFLIGVLNGWTDGDGIGPNRNGGRTVSRSLAMCMYDIATGIGYQPAIYCQHPKLSHGVKSRQSIWNVEWGNNKLIQKSDYRKHQNEKYVWRRVESIEKENFEGYVFNLEVEGDHSYVAEGIGVHNCASESMTGCIMAIRVFNGQKPVKLNPWFAYNTVSGGSDRGSTLPDNVAFAQKYGVASQDVWSRSNGWRTKPSNEAYSDAENYKLLEVYSVSNWEEFGTALLLGWPVYFGYTGHAIWATKLLDESRLEYCNSWGDWGDHGFGTLSNSRVVWSYRTYAFRVVTIS